MNINEDTCFMFVRLITSLYTLIRRGGALDILDRQRVCRAATPPWLWRLRRGKLIHGKVKPYVCEFWSKVTQQSNKLISIGITSTLQFSLSPLNFINIRVHINMNRSLFILFDRSHIFFCFFIILFELGCVESVESVWSWNLKVEI